MKTIPKYKIISKTVNVNQDNTVYEQGEVEVYDHEVDRAIIVMDVPDVDLTNELIGTILDCLNNYPEPEQNEYIEEDIGY